MPIDIQNIGEDTYCLMARGHHDPHEFMRAVRAAGYNWPLGVPEQCYARTLPPPDPSYVCRYAFADKPGRGAYPVTYVTEAYGDDRYEAVIAREAPASRPPSRASDSHGHAVSE